MAIARKYCTMVNDDICNILPTIPKSILKERRKPYFLRSTLQYVYIRKNTSEEASAITDAKAAPLTPICGNPSSPNTRP